MMGCVLRSIVREDLVMLREHRNRADTRVWLGDARTVSAEQQIAWYERHDPSCYKIALISDVPVGLVRVTHADPFSACVGSDVFAPYRGQGYGHVVFAAACELAQRRSLWLRVFIENRRALVIYEKAGFVLDQNAPVEQYLRTIPGDTVPRLLSYARMIREEDSV